MHIADTLFHIVNSFNESMYEEIGDQDGYYDGAIRSFSDAYYNYAEEGYPANSMDWIKLAKDALVQTRAKITADDHPLGPLKMRHKMNILWNLGTALTSLKMLKYPNYIPVLER